MSDNSRVRNLSILIVLGLIYTIPALFLTPHLMLDIISVPMLVYGLYGLYLLFPETWRSFWSGDQTRAAIGLYGLSLLLMSVVIMRPYGIADRNIPNAAWLASTHIFPIALFMQAIGLMLFTRASSTAYIPTQKTKWGQLIAGIIIGALVATSKVLEPVLMAIGKLFGRLV